MELSWTGKLLSAPGFCPVLGLVLHTVYCIFINNLDTGLNSNICKLVNNTQ